MRAVSTNKRVAEEAYKAVTGEIIQGRYNFRRDTKSLKFEEYTIKGILRIFQG